MGGDGRERDEMMFADPRARFVEQGAVERARWCIYRWHVQVSFVRLAMCQGVTWFMNIFSESLHGANTVAAENAGLTDNALRLGSGCITQAGGLPQPGACVNSEPTSPNPSRISGSELDLAGADHGDDDRGRLCPKKSSLWNRRGISLSRRAPRLCATVRLALGTTGQLCTRPVVDGARRRS